MRRISEAMKSMVTPRNTSSDVSRVEVVRGGAVSAGGSDTTRACGGAAMAMACGC
jgi:hypothetical protein